MTTDTRMPMDPGDMPRQPQRLVILGLSITSSWGNGHATTYRGLVRELHRAGCDVLFLERDVPWYAQNRDLPRPPYGRTELYTGLDELSDRWQRDIRDADAVIVGSYVPQADAVGEFVTRTARGVAAFYDIDTPVTLAQLARRECDYLTADLIATYDLYLSFTSGPLLEALQTRHGARMARPLCCSVDPEAYRPMAEEPVRWDLGYLGTYSTDRQPAVERLLLQPAADWPDGRFVVAGPQYPPDTRWRANVERVEHLAPAEHARFYNAQRFTLNVTRADMIRWGYCPSVRLFEAAACGTPILSDVWEGIEEFFRPGEEIVLVRDAREVLECLGGMSEDRRIAMAQAARRRVLWAHTAAHRARELLRWLEQARGNIAARPARAHR